MIALYHAIDMQRFMCLLAYLSTVLSTVVYASPKIFVAYPPNGHTLQHSHVILEGSVSAGASLNINNQAVKVDPDGLFMLWWPLKEGRNSLKMVSGINGEKAVRRLSVNRIIPKTLLSAPTQIVPSSWWPSQPLSFWKLEQDSMAERRVEVGFRGSPTGRAVAVLAGKRYPLREITAGVYSGWLDISPVTQQKKIWPLRFELTGSDGKTASVRGSTISLRPDIGARLAHQKPEMIQGLAVNSIVTSIKSIKGDSLLFPASSTHYTVIGKEGHDYRVRLGAGLSGLINGKQIKLSSRAPTPIWGGDITLEADNSKETILRISLKNGKSPYFLQQLGPNQLSLKLFGLQRPPILASPLNDPRQLGGLGISRASLRTASTEAKVSELIIDFRQTQLWGFYAQHDVFSDDLLLVARKPPLLDAANEAPLSGRVITLDAGHGGRHEGGRGSFGVHEKDLVLPITLLTAAKLRKMGATVHLTRQNDMTLGLYERVLLAEDMGSELLVSIHANALPDGVNPLGVRGPEIFFSHLQAQNVSEYVLRSLRQFLPENGYGMGLRPNANFALTRPSAQISLLVELGYLTDAQNLRALSDPIKQDTFAEAIALGIRDFYVNSVK